MLARSKSPSQRSAIINITAYQTHGQSSYKMPVYASCKSMQDHMSRIFGLEVEDKNMDVLTVRGMPVKSERFPNGVEAEDLVEGALRDLGEVRVSYGHWTHSLYRHYILWIQCNWWFPQKPRLH